MTTATQTVETPTVTPKQWTIPTRMKSWEKIQTDKRWINPITKKLTGRAPFENKARYEELVEGLWAGDQAMDDVLVWMLGSSAAANKRMFEQALQNGIESIENCPEPLKKFFAEHVDKIPDWYDQEKIDRAQRFICATGINANYILRDVALMGGYLLSGFNQTLVLTGALNKSASKRLAETSKWWIDCTGPGGLGRFGAGFKTTFQVRMIHALVRRSFSKRDDWKFADWGVPINQVDMAATNLAFCALFLMGLRGIGIFATPTESEAVMHFWKYLGWLMGVEEKWLVDNEAEGDVLLYELFQTQADPDWTSKALGEALSKEPFEHENGGSRLEKWQKQFDYQKHLSINRLFLGSKRMEQLGLPSGVLPWFPLIITPKNLLSFRLQRAVPFLRKLQIKRGRQEQLDYLAGFGAAGQSIIKPDEKHPAYVK